MNKRYSDLIKDFERDCRLKEMTRQSTLRYLSCLRIFARFLETRGVFFEDIAKQDLIDYILYSRDERKVKPTTLEMDFIAFNSFYKFLLFKERITVNHVPVIRERYLRGYGKNTANGDRRKVIPAEEMARYLTSIMNPRDKAIATLLVKSGIRCGELVSIDLDDIDWSNNTIRLKKKRKRTNCIVMFDHECAKVLRHWLMVRGESYVKPGCNALFTGQTGERLEHTGIYRAVTKPAKRLGYFDKSSPENKDHFSTHNLRHCFTTYLRQNGMKREFIQELRGDSRRDAVDIYDHIDLDELRQAYLAAMPMFGL